MGEKEFELNLDALDGYKLPGSEDEAEEKISPKKRKRRSKPQVLGVNYREIEEKRLEELLFGELVQAFEKKEALLTETPDSVITKTTVKDEESGQAGTSVTETKKRKITSSDTLVPENEFAKALGVKSATQKKAAWVDEDDENIKYNNLNMHFSRFYKTSLSLQIKGCSS